MAHDLVSLSGNLQLIDQLYDQYQRDPAGLDPSWRELFKNGPPSRLPAVSAEDVGNRTAVNSGSATTERRAALAANPLVWAFRTRGHLAANLDPLDMLERPGSPELEPSSYGFDERDMADMVDSTIAYGLADRTTLSRMVAHLRRTYCGAIGLEFMHISTPKKKHWLAERMESRFERNRPSDTERVSMLRQLIAAESFESFIHTKFPGTKRFSLEGGESLIPLLEQVLDQAGRLGAIEAVVGMAHRGRLNVLTQTMGRAARDLFTEFEDIEPETILGGGDVKYHLGHSGDRTDSNGNHLHVSLAFNPSHLEAVDPVVCGRVRAKQRRHADWERRQIVGILIHGDAAFAGQGLVSETLQLSNLTGYRTGGTVHIIVNNQIGFTASPTESRSTPYCTDVAKMIQCPIWHVNGEDLDAVYRVVEMAMEYRSTFQSDVVIDMFCYRKFGHNEMDEPSFTQPLMYKRIREKEPIDVIYGRQLCERNVMSAADVEKVRSDFKEELSAELEAGRKAEHRPQIQTMGGLWSPYRGGVDSETEAVQTGVAIDRLREIGSRLTEPPAKLTLHRKILRLLKTRREMVDGERAIDWGMAELLAYGSLLWEGTNVRMSGQDSARGTFSHRHALVTDIENGTEHLALNHLHPEQGECRIYDSPLSEAGVLGFEFGYSLDYPDALVIWEAQFGDFANGAQVIIDQFITASEDKWNRLSGLVMFLPHGYEGQGPEHSSARPERYLQQCAEDNIQVVQPSTPAQCFHMLRRQIHRPFRKPLIVFTPKSLLRLAEATSTLDEFSRGSFQRVIADDTAPADQVEKVIVCSGRVYYTLAKERAERADQSTAIIRLEQFYPLADDEIGSALDRFGRLRELVWAQDEPSNMGAQTFVWPMLSRIAEARDLKLRAVSREASASPATGSHTAHGIEERRLLDDAFAPVRSN